MTYLCNFFDSRRRLAREEVVIRSESCIGTLVSWFDSDQPGFDIADRVEELKRTVNFPGRIHYPNLFT